MASWCVLILRYACYHQSLCDKTCVFQVKWWWGRRERDRQTDRERECVWEREGEGERGRGRGWKKDGGGGGGLRDRGPLLRRQRQPQAKERKFVLNRKNCQCGSCCNCCVMKTMLSLSLSLSFLSLSLFRWATWLCHQLMASLSNMMQKKELATFSMWLSTTLYSKRLLLTLRHPAITAMKLSLPNCSTGLHVRCCVYVNTLVSFGIVFVSTLTCISRGCVWNTTNLHILRLCVWQHTPTSQCCVLSAYSYLPGQQTLDVQ